MTAEGEWFISSMSLQDGGAGPTFSIVATRWIAHRREDFHVSGRPALDVPVMDAFDERSEVEVHDGTVWLDGQKVIYPDTTT